MITNAPTATRRPAICARAWYRRELVRCFALRSAKRSTAVARIYQRGISQSESRRAAPAVRFGLADAAHPKARAAKRPPWPLSVYRVPRQKVIAGDPAV